MIAARQKIIIAEYKADDSIRAIVLDAPKLYEARVDQLCEAVIFVKAFHEARVSRIKARGWTDFQLTQREAMQDSLTSKEARSDYIIENNSNLDILNFQVKKVFSCMLRNSR